MGANTSELIKHLKNSSSTFPEHDNLLIGSRAAQFVINGDVNSLGNTRDWDIICVPNKLINWLEANKSAISEISYIETPGIETNARVVIKNKENGRDDTLDFTVPLSVQSSVHQILLYMLRDPKVYVPFPGGDTCRVPSLDLLLAIKRGHLYYSVKWNAHINSYHELLKHKASLSSSSVPSPSSSSASPPSPSSSPSSSFHPSLNSPLNNTNVLKNIQLQLTKDGKTLHKGKTVAPQLPPFSTDYDFSQLSKNQKLQLITQLLATYKSTFSTFRAALEWACTTGPTSVADVIIDGYPDLVAIGDVIWDAREEDAQDNFRKLGLDTNFVNLEYLKMGNNKFPPLSFGMCVLPTEVNFNILYWSGWARNLQACACVSREWNTFFQNRKVWRQLYVIRWNIQANDKELENIDWKKYYVKRCKDAIYWEGVNEKHNPTSTPKSDDLREFTRQIRSFTTEKILEIFEKFESRYARANQDVKENSELPKLAPADLQAAAQRLVNAMRYSYVTDYTHNPSAIPEFAQVELSLYSDKSVEPILVIISSESGERGNSRHSYYCVQITLYVDHKKVLRYDKMELENLGFAKWGFNQHNFGHLSARKTDFLDLPSKLVVPWCLVMFPEKMRKRLLDHFVYGASF